MVGYFYAFVNEFISCKEFENWVYDSAAFLSDMPRKLHKKCKRFLIFPNDTEIFLKLPENCKVIFK